MSAPDILSVEDLHVTLGTKHVLQGISLTFKKGEVTAITGPNGAGKSTLLNCLSGLLTPERGTAHLGDEDLFAMAPRMRARKIGYLPQTPEIAWGVDARTFAGLGRTPFIGAWGLTAGDQEIVDKALRLTEADALADRNVKTLSGGERARVLLARALAGEPEWLLADEPMTALDPGYQLDMATLFRALAQDGKCVIVTMHDLQMAIRVADRVVMIADGKIIADGTPDVALAPAVLSAAYGIETQYISGRAGPLLEIVKRHG